MKSLRYLLLLAGVLGIAPAMAQADDAEDRDAQMAAKMRGIPVLEAKRQAQLDRKAAILEERLSNNPNFVGLEIVRAGSTYRVKASFKRGNKPDKQTLNADQDLDAALDTVEGLYSKAEQRQAVATIMSTLRPAGIKFNAYPDQSTGVVVVETDQVSKVTDLLKALGDRISVVQGTAFPAPTVDLRGGQTVTFGDGGGGTSAFPVKNCHGARHPYGWSWFHPLQRNLVVGSARRLVDPSRYLDT